MNDVDLDIWLMGLRLGTPEISTGIPSNLAFVHVRSDGYCQDDACGIPFTGGIAPGWAAWSTRGEPNRAAFEQGDKYATLDIESPVYEPKGLLSKPYFQLIKAPPRGSSHGVYRKFLGLAPGHTYRLTACLNTMNMNSIKGDWSFSVHGAPTWGKDLNPEQFAGGAALPDKRSGAEAAQVASFGPGQTTSGDFGFGISGHAKLRDGTPSAHITLPSGANEITVWVRFSCDDPAGEVGLSGLKLEDLTATGNPKSPQQLVQEETDKEMQLMKWVDKMSQWKEVEKKREAEVRKWREAEAQKKK